jgi:hypothetical protein
MPTKEAVVKELLSDLYPGDDASVALVRREVERISATPGPVVVLLQGPPGTGKTTMARTIAVCRRILLVEPTGLAPTLESARQDVLSQKPLTWYRDISLAGLVETLAEAQLFGIGGKVATGVTARVGLFEQAMTGHDPSESVEPHHKLLAAAKQKKRWAPLVTGGVVLLDEIGDLALNLQAKLLRVLNGEKQYRLGEEGHDAYAFQYAGITIMATWRDLAALKDFRQDLWQRIRFNQISVPSLSAYARLNLTRIIRTIHRQFRDQAQDEIDRLNALGQGVEADICSAEWLSRLALASKQDLTPETEAELSGLDMKAIGEFRGLRNVISRVVSGSSVKDAVESAYADDVNTGESDHPLDERDINTLAEALETESLSMAWKEQRSSWAKRINTMLVARDPRVETVIAESGRQRATVKKQVENLLRSELSD